MKRVHRSVSIRARQQRPNQVQVVRPAISRQTMVGLDITPEQLRWAMRSARGGEPAKLFAIQQQFYDMDDEIPAAMGTLIASVLAEEYKIIPIDDSAEAVRQAEVFTDLFRQMDMLNLIEDLLLSDYFGMRAHELKWDAFTSGNASYQLPVTWEQLPHDWIYARKVNKDDEYNALWVGDQPYYEYPKGSILLSSSAKLPSYQNIDFTRFGKGIGCMRFAIMKYYDIEDWASFNEAFATPLILGELTDGWLPKDKEILEDAVMNMANNSRGITTNKSRITFPEAGKTSSVDAFERFYSLLNKIISVKIKSESQTDQMNKHGSNAAMVTAYGIQLNVARKLMRKMVRLIQRNLMQPAADLNFGGRLLCTFEMKVKAIDDMTKEIQVDEKLQRMGFNLSRTEIMKRYGRSEAEDEEDTLARPASSILNLT